MDILDNKPGSNSEQKKLLFEKGFFEPSSKPENKFFNLEIRQQVYRNIYTFSEETAQESLLEVSESEEEYKRFVNFFVMVYDLEFDNQQKSLNNILNDEDLISAWEALNLVEYGTVERGEKQLEFWGLLQAKLKSENLKSPIPDVEWKKLLTTFGALELHKGIYERVNELDKKAVEEKNNEKILQYQQFKQESQEMLQLFVEGKITQEEYQQFFIDFAKSSDDEQLTQMAEEYEKVLYTEIEKGTEKEAEEEEEVESKQNEKPVQDEQEFDQVISNSLQSTGKRIEYLGNGKAEVNIQGIKVDLYLRKVLDASGTDTGRYVAYLKDENTFGKPKPIKIDDLEMALDRRYLDNIISDKISENIVGQNYIKDIPDKMLVELCERLVGEGSDRGFVLSGEQIALIEKLSIIVANNTDTKNSLYEKIDDLLVAVNTEEDETVLRTAVEEEVESVDDILNRLQNNDIEDAVG